MGTKYGYTNKAMVLLMLCLSVGKQHFLTQCIFQLNITTKTATFYAHTKIHYLFMNVLKVYCRF